VAMALDATPPVITPSLSPAAPDGANGWYRVPVGVTWQIGDAESPVIDPVGCGPVSLTGSAALTCSATSAGGTTAAPLSIKIDTTPPSAPAFTGIGAKTYVSTALPSARAIGCTASDPTSGVIGCSVTGYGSGFGVHTLTATATNAAGLTSTDTLEFTVVKPLAISKLKLLKLTLARLRSSGLTLEVRVAAASTRLVVKVVATVPRASVAGTRTITIGSLTRRNLAAGTHTLRVALTAGGKLALSALAKTSLKVTVGASSSRAEAASLKGSLLVTR